MTTDWREEFSRLICDSDPRTSESSSIRATYIKRPHVPPSIFKYRDVDKDGFSLKNLENDQVWLASADSFNDPYDCSVVINHEQLMHSSMGKVIPGMPALPNAAKMAVLEAKLFERMKGGRNLFEAIEDLLIDEGHLDAIQAKQAAAELREALLDISRQKSGPSIKALQSGMKVCSFCAAPVELGLLMWGHYARWHEGFCIEYRTADLKDTSLLHPVLYSLKRFDITPYIEQMHSGVVLTFTHAMALFKHPDWAYEEEWRLFAPLGGGAYAKGMAVDMPTPAAVYLGSRMPDSDKVKVLSITQRRGIPTFQMVLSHDSFRLVSKPIP